MPTTTRRQRTLARPRILPPALGVAVVLLLVASAHSPALHAWFHPVLDACAHEDPSTASYAEDRCAIVLFSQGLTTPPPLVLIIKEHEFTRRSAIIPPPAPLIGQRVHAHPLAHAPPVGRRA